MMKTSNIIIIGAGASGIAAARRLVENGYTDLVILEAENRIGGRINSTHFGENVVDLGAQWCHGEKDNVVYNMVKELNLLDGSFNTYRDNTFYDSTGKQLDKYITDRLSKIFEEIAYDEDTLKNTRGSFGDYFIKCYNKCVAEENNYEYKKISEKMLDWFHKLTLCYDASPNWFDLSASGRTHFEECEGNPLLHWKDKGFKTILDVIMKEYPDVSKALPIKNKIKLNKEVSQINWNDQMNVTVNCVDGSVYKADHVILTASLGVLKENYKTMFKPDLPPYKQNAIEGLSIGTVNKIFLKFPHKWWPNDCKGFSLVWDEDNRMNILNEFPDGPSKDGKSWLEDIFGFYVIDSDPKTLLGWVVGEQAHKVELLSDDVLTSGCIYLLEKFLGDKYTIPKPDRILCTKWFSNTHFRGSYSYRSIESDKRNAFANDLAEPLVNKFNRMCLLFAGEATHSKYYSSVHGAIESGFREADRLINLYMNPVEKRCKVAIVGSGMAGLGAARTFLEEGIKDIILLEARDRPGGRIDTIHINDGVIELGAQWLHGTCNFLYEIAKKNGLILAEKSDEGMGIYVRNDGLIFDEYLVKKVDFEIGKILEDCEKFVECNLYPKSVGEFLEEKFLDYLDRSDDKDDVKEMKRELYDWHVKFQVIDNSCKHLKQVSAKDWGNYSCLGKNGQQHLNIKNGYKSLVDILVDFLPQDTLILNTPVLNINYTNDTIKLECRGGVTILADHVIVTSSIGTLKQDFLKFQPELPRPILNAVKNMGFHGMGKIFLLFKKKWWKTDGFQLLWKRNSLITNSRQWTKYITGFDLVLNQPNMLVGWIGGKGIEIMETMTEEEVGVHCVDLLRNFLNNEEIPYPVKVLRSTWFSCPWIKGGYSHTTPACDRSGSGPSSLSTPLVINGVPKVLFAGEAAHSFNFSTTHGAFESGEMQARVVLNFLMK